MLGITKRMQLNYYVNGSKNPVIIIIHCDFRDGEHFEKWLAHILILLRSHQGLYHSDAKAATIRVRSESAPIPRSKPATVIPAGVTPNIDDLLKQSCIAA